jgi:hypothetical protein
MDFLITFILCMGSVYLILRYRVVKELEKQDKLPKEKPCPLHRWELVEVTNEYGEKEERLVCGKCKKRPGIEW